MAILDVIKFEGDSTSFIWKHPAEDFNTASQLIVHESQEAVFFRDGQALDTFGPGRYTLETQNIPVLNRLVNLPTGGVSAFHCEVYFINKTVQMALRWGTDSRVRFLDPLTGVPLEIGACGEMNLQVQDGRKLLVKLVGATSGIAWSQQGQDGFVKSLKDSFWPLISTSVKANLSQAIKARNIDLLEIDEHLQDLSSELGARVATGFEEYGLAVPQFYVTSVMLPEDDPNFRHIRDIHAAELAKRLAQVEAEVKKTQVQAHKDVQLTEAAAQAEVTAAQRAATLEQQVTDTEVARYEAARQVIAAQAQAEAAKATGMAEAEVMRAQGYNQKDVLQAEVQKAYAAGIGQMGSGDGGSGGGITTDLLGLGVGLSAMGAMMPQLNNIMQGLGGQPANPQVAGTVGFGQTAAASMSAQGQAAAPSEGSACAACGAALPEGAKFCPVCGEKVTPAVPQGMMVCPACGKQTPAGKFCMECGSPLVRACPACGAQVAPGAKFCPECGQKL